ncbi:hypothetical protein [Conexibacter sp. CPCC 206217]|uniref:hypothetical protein n=1 Tax=Conexibacter sp. CPCC 206217 TaxID=3064574 RepID=UPI0027163C7D|nr:hypothetical protein [Conexibacter sp. CPCC 206217]MDO8210998.1 hypothetical protein [Conexibacter sp. CPCC 206217]
MNPVLTTIQNDVRAAELRERSERRRPRTSNPSLQPVESSPAAARSTAFGALFLGHGFFGREHGSAA